MAEQGLLTGSTYTRPANFANMGFPASCRCRHRSALRIRSESGQPVSSDEGRRLVEELETALIEVVREPDDVDGVEFGATDGVIFLRGPDCKRMWTIVQPFARACPLRPAHATLHRTVEGVDVKERIDL